VPSAVDRWVTDLARAHYHRALLIRPFLPEMLPEWETILWLDSDCWVQDLDSVELIFDVAEDRRDCAVVTPLLDLAYYPLFDFPAQFIRDNVSAVYDAFYGADVSADLSLRPILSMASFAMRRDNLWDAWAAEIERLFRCHEGVAENILHVAEQTAFNCLAYSSGKYVALSARHSFVASLGPLTRNDDGTVVVHEPEHRRVGIIQLSGVTDGHAPRYLDEGLLFGRGRLPDTRGSGAPPLAATVLTGAENRQPTRLDNRCSGPSCQRAMAHSRSDNRLR
jgi:hypothetical protein